MKITVLVRFMNGNLGSVVVRARSIRQAAGRALGLPGVLSVE